jgi:hypothetical protein
MTTQMYPYGVDGWLKTVNDRGTYIFEDYHDGKYGCCTYTEGAHTEVAYATPITPFMDGFSHYASPVWMRNTKNYGWLSR